MNSMWKRSFALLLSLVMVFGMMPVNAFADESGAVETTAATEETVVETTEATVVETTEETVAETTEETVIETTEETVVETTEETVTETTEETEEETTEAAVVCDSSDNCAAEVHEKTCVWYDWCAELGCTWEVHHADCPWGPCTLTEGCELVKGHPGECTGAGVFALTGEGTEASPYLINNLEDLKYLQTTVNNGENYAGKYFKLTAGITLDGEWTPIGNGARSGSGYTGNAFKGNFDGGNFTVSGLTITTTTGADVALGLFGVVDGGAVRDLNLTGVSISVSTSECAGGAIGVLTGGGIADDITVSGSVSAKRGNGGIVGRMLVSGTISNCVNNAAMSATGGANLGGIAGAAYYTAEGKTMTITNCVNYGTVTGAAGGVGGIVGLSTANVSGCTNNGAVSAAGASVGGIIGEQQNYGTVSGNTNTANVTNNTSAYGNGGIIGWVRYSGAASNYPRKGVISVNNNNNSGTISGANDAGGIVGTVYNAANVTDNTNTAASLTASSFAAGIVGNVQYAETPVQGTSSDSVTIPKDTVNIINNKTTTETITANNKHLVAYDNSLGSQQGKIYNNSYPGMILVAEVNGDRYDTLATAIEKADNGDTITLIDDVEEAVVITKPVTLDLGSKTITSTAKKAITVGTDNVDASGATVTIKNGTINNAVNAGRCVDIRSNYTVNLTGLTMNTTGAGNNQAVNVGGYTNGTVLNMSGCTVNAGVSGYSITSFIKSNITVTDSDLNGHGNIYLKQGSGDSTVTVGGSSALTTSFADDGTGFGSIVFEESSNSTVTVASTVSITAGEYAVGFNAGGYQNTVHLNGTVSADEEILMNYILGMGTVTTTSTSVKDKLEEEGHSLSEANGVYTIVVKVADAAPEIKVENITAGTGVDDDVLEDTKTDIAGNENIKEKIETNLDAAENAEAVNNAAEKAVEKFKEENTDATVIINEIEPKIQVSDPVINSQVTITVEGREVDIPKEMTFDVTPIAVTTVTVIKGEEITTEELTEEVEALEKSATFRLPVHSAVPAGTSANVYHEGVPVGIHEVVVHEDGNYIEVSSKEFSPFKVSLLLNGEKGVASDGTNEFVTLQEAIDAANKVPGKHTITLTGAVTEDVLITQTAGVDLVIDGAGNTFTGLMTVYGQQRYKATETLEIKNINFVAPAGASACIVSPSKDDGYATLSYSHNVTVSDCTFSGGSDNATAAIRLKQGGDADWTITDCTVNENLHSLLQAAGVHGELKITECTVNAVEGVNLNQSQNVVMEGNTITAEQYAVRIGASGDVSADAKNLTMNNNKLTATGSEGTAVVVRGTSTNASVNMEENTVSAKTHISGTTEDTQVEADNNYWNGMSAPVVSGTPVPVASYYTDKDRTELEPGAAAVAKIGNTYYSDINKAITELQTNGGTMTLLAKIDDDITATITKTAVLDLNGYDIGTGTVILTVDTNGDLTLKDSKEIGHVSGQITVNDGKFTMKSGTISGSSENAVTVSGGEAVIEGGNVCTSLLNSTVISVTSGKLTVSGGTIGGGDGRTSIAATGGAVEILGGHIYGQMTGTGRCIPGLVEGEPNTAEFGYFDPTPFCEVRYAGSKGNDDIYKIVPAAACVIDSNNNVVSDYPTVAAAVKTIQNGQILNIIADAEDSTKDTLVIKTAAMNMAANAQGGVTITANVPANSKYVEIPVKGVTYRVGVCGDLTISAKGVVGGDNVPIKDGKPVYTLKPQNSQASYLSGSNATLTFESNMIFATFTKAYIDGTEIVLDKDYVATPGSTIITLANARLRTQSAGKHTLMIKDDSNNTVSCDFHVTVNANADPTNPKTGDGIFVPMFVMFSTAAALAVLLMGKKKHA